MATREQEAVGLISVKVQLRGVLSWIVNESDTIIEVAPGASLMDVVTMLGKRYGEELQKVLLGSDGAVYRGIAIFIDQETIPYHQLAKIKIERTCAITLIPLAAGG
jgi:molybdopterin converting factor small subunit